MLRYDWLVCVWGAGLSKGPFIPKQSVSFVFANTFLWISHTSYVLYKVVLKSVQAILQFFIKVTSFTEKQTNPGLHVCLKNAPFPHKCSGCCHRCFFPSLPGYFYLIIRWRCAENLSCSWFCGVFSVASGKLGALRLKVRLVEDRILPSVYYQPLIHLLVESVISPTEVSFTICPQPQPHQHLSWFIKSINQ